MTKIKEMIRYLRLRFLPKKLWSRTILILVLPVILLQTVSAFLFYDNHWKNVSRRLALSVASDIKGSFTLYDNLDAGNGKKELLKQFHSAADHRIRFLEAQSIPTDLKVSLDTRTAELVPVLKNIGIPFSLRKFSDEKQVLITFYLPNYTAEITLPYKKFFSSTTYVFSLWVLFSSFLFTSIAVLFLRNQIRPVLRLAEAAKNFGMGQEIGNFKPEGAMEVRQAAISFLQMKDRIRKHIEERTRMLAGVSHDLRTPLTRMRLQLAMMEKNEDIDDLKQDVFEMERMVNAYLDFVRGEGKEKMQSTDIAQLITQTLSTLRNEKFSLQFFCHSNVTMNIRPDSFKRCLWNLVSNASRYGNIVNVSMTATNKILEIIVEDNGPGIPVEKREDVFKAFFRLDESRNTQTGGVGLGLAITRDIILSHGGKIYMQDSDLGGLKVVMIFPF